MTSYWRKLRKMKAKFFSAPLTAMSMVFAALLGASVPLHAKFIGIAIYDGRVMLPICKNEIAQGRAGVCTGYVIAKWESMQEYSSWVPHDALCIPPGTEYEDMVQVVVSWTELRLRDPEVMSPFDFRTLTEAALRHTWGCKK